MSSWLTSLLSSWRATKGSASERRRCWRSLNINTNSPQNPCLGRDFEERSNSPRQVQWNNECHQVWRHPLSISFAFCPDGHRLYQDNDPKHTSKVIQIFFLQNGINWWKSPAESPDLNPTEKVWGSMKTYLRGKCKTRCLPELKLGIRTYWSKLTPELCSRYIDQLQKVMPIVVEEEGCPYRHWTIIFYGRTVYCLCQCNCCSCDFHCIMIV